MDYRKQEKMYKALANRRRLHILAYLNSTRRASVQEIAEHIGLSFKATSKHLQVLKSAEMVGDEQVSLERYYFLLKDNKYLKQALTNL